MIKNILRFITLVIIILVIYLNRDVPPHKIEISHLPQVIEQVNTKAMVKTLHIEPIYKDNVIIKNNTFKKLGSRIIPKNPNNIIGKDLSLELIENKNISEEDKQHMIDDLAYYQSMQADQIVLVSGKENEALFQSDLENGLIK